MFQEKTNYHTEAKRSLQYNTIIKRHKWKKNVNVEKKLGEPTFSYVQIKTTGCLILEFAIMMRHKKCDFKK